MKTTTDDKKKIKSTPMGAALIEALTEAIAFKRGTKTGATLKTVSVRRATAKPAPAYRAKDIAKLRKQLRMSQPLFADVLNVSSAAVKAWEQGQNEPGGATLRLLQIAEAHPDILLEQVRSTV
jgi:putative transcriptional regulator